MKLTERRHRTIFTRSHTPMLIKVKTILWMIRAFFKEIYELITGKRKWT